MVFWAGFECRCLLKAGHLDEGSSEYCVYVGLSGTRCGTLWPYIRRVVGVS